MQRRSASRLTAAHAAVLLCSLVLAAACQASSVQPAELQPTLSFEHQPGGTVAFQDGIPVPGFGLQPDRPRLNLVEGWRFEPAVLDQKLSFESRRRATVDALDREAAGRQQPSFDDAAWSEIAVPGSFSNPPQGRTHGGWYRLHFKVPVDWSGRAATLKFSAVDYLADVWLNGHYLGYHEGGYTPFAFDATGKLLPGQTNTLAVRVDAPAPGTRLDIVPWGLADWWEYGGITRPVWLEASDPVAVVRADVVPHLDAAEVTAVLQNRTDRTLESGRLRLTILPAAISTANLLDPDPSGLVPLGAAPVAEQTLDSIDLPPHGVAAYEVSFVLAGADSWSPSRPALYVLSADLTGTTAAAAPTAAPATSPTVGPSPSSGRSSPPAAVGPSPSSSPAPPIRHSDTYFDSFGLRTIQVDSAGPRLLLNGEPTAFAGVTIQDEQVWPARPGPDSVRGGPAPTPADWQRLLEQAGAVHADLIRSGHIPPDPNLLMLADRTGFAVWEEIPLTHNTPQTLTLAMARGIPQQMLAEMDLRDFNRPSVLFHGFANESKGVAERTQAMSTLNDLDHRLDGTRLTGQAMYGSDPTDSSSSPLDVAGYTFYYGVFYGGADIRADTLRALAQAHRTYPTKPIMVLEFGRWADNPSDEQTQNQVFSATFGALRDRWGTRPGGYVGAAVWWTLEDYWTDLPGIGVEHFGLYRPTGSPRPVAAVAGAAYQEVAGVAGEGAEQGIVSGGRGVAPSPPELGSLVGYAAYALAVSTALTLLLAAVLVAGRRRRWRGV